MATLRKVPAAHTDLLLELSSKELGEADLNRLKDVTKAEEFGSLRAGELERIKSISDLFQKLEHKNVIKVGDYRKLKKLMEKIDRLSTIALIKDAEKQLCQKGYNVVSSVEDYAESPSGSGTRLDVPPSCNNNNQRMPSQISFEDALPMDIPADITDNSQFLDDRPRYEDGKGFVLFINNFVTHAHNQCYLRQGCEIDAKSIEHLFEEYLPENRYKLVTKEDLTKPKLQNVLQDTRRKLIDGRFTKFLLIICSHGEQTVVEQGNKKYTEECIYMVDGQTITEEELTAPFMGDQLKEFKGKPKVFIIQACRSPRKPDKPDDFSEEHNKRSRAEPEPGPPVVTRPVNADILISYATTKGTRAWRNEEQGSWFIDHFCKIIKDHYKKEHLMDLLVRVNDEVSKMDAVVEGGGKQMPCQVSTLTKNIWM